jgi:phosphoinositide 3-kinase adapter protein 1
LGIATDILGRALRQQPLCAEATTPTSKPILHENFTLFPRKVKIGQNKVLVIFTDPLVKEDWIKIKIEKTGSVIEITNVKRRNPYTVQFVVPETCMEVSTMIGVRIERNNIDLGCRPVKCESRLRELEQLLKCQDNPMEFMCQSIGISLSERDKLDDFFVQSFQKNVSPDFHLLSSNDDCRNGKCRESCKKDNLLDYDQLVSSYFCFF